MRIKYCWLIGINNRFLSSYLNEFEKTIGDTISSNDLLVGFSKFFQSRYPEYMSEFMKLHFISVCYKDDRPMLCAMNGTIGSCGFDNGVASSDTTDFGWGGKYNIKYCITHTCKEIKPLIKKEIMRYARVHHKENAIGGNIMFIKLTPDKKIGWFGSPPKKPNWNNINDFIIEYMEGKEKITFISEEAKNRIYKLYHLDSIEDKSHHEIVW